MEELPLFPDGANDVVPLVTNQVAQEAFRETLKGVPSSDILIRFEQKGTLFRIGVNKPERTSGIGTSRPHGYGFGGMLTGAIGDGVYVAKLVRSMGKAAESMKEVRMVYLSQKITTEDFPSDIQVLYQGGFVQENIVALSTVSIGTLFDFAVPQGFALMCSGRRIELYHTQNSDSNSELSENPLTHFISDQIKDKKSHLRNLLRKISNKGLYKSSKKKYRIKSPSMLYIVPCLGKTIVSVVAGAFGEKPQAQSRIFPMRDLGKDKPINFEVSTPSVQVIRDIRDILKLIYAQKERFEYSEPVTASEFGVGTSVLLALELARRKYLPDRGPFTMWELMENGPFVKKTVDAFKKEYSKIEIHPRTSFPRILIKK